MTDRDYAIKSMKEITFIQRIVQNSKILHFNGCFFPSNHIECLKIDKNVIKYQ